MEASASWYNEALFHCAFSEAGIGMALVGLDGRWLKVNRSLCHLVGYSETELLSRDFQSITHPADLEADLAQAQRLLRGDIASYDLEKRYLHRDDHDVWVLLTRSVVRGVGGSPQFFIAQVQDITERRKIQAGHEELFRFSPDLMAVAVGDRLNETNPAWAEVLGWQSDEITSRPYLEFTHPDDKEVIRSAFGAVGVTGARRLVRSRFLHCSGKYRWLEWQLRTTADSRIFCSARDVTEKTLAEEALVHSNKELERFSFHVAHDLKQPLQVMVGHGSYLLLSARSKLTQREAESLDLVLQTSRHLAEVTDALLALARLNQTMATEQVDLSVVLATCLAYLQSELDECGAKVTAAVLPSIRCNRMLVTQVLQNLLANAIKFRGARSLEINITATEDVTQNQWILTVRDNGVGIPPEAGDIIFEPFRRIDVNSAAPGLGLGLGIIQASIEKQGGRVWYESVVGEGSTFYLALPKLDAQAEAEQTDVVAPLEGQMRNEES